MATDESLGAMLDEYLVTGLLARLGPGGGYSDLLVRTAKATIVRDVEDWRHWERPGLIVMCRNLRRLPGPHGDGDLHFIKRYQYVAAAITDGDQVNALRDGRILESRIEAALCEMALGIDLVAANGERVQEIQIGDSSTLMYRNRTSERDNWQALPALAFVVESLL